MKTVAGTLLLLLAACFDELGPEKRVSRLTAVIDGSRLTELTSVGGDRAGNSLYIGAGGNGRFVGFSVRGVTGRGVYPLISSPGSYGMYYEGPSNSHWETRGTEPQGFVLFTNVTKTRAAGSFAFTVVPITPSATGAISIREGSFDVELTESVEDQSLNRLPALRR